MYVHLTVRAIYPPLPIVHDDVASWLWRKLRRAYPHPLAVLLMPDHAHACVPAADAELERRRMSAVLSGLRRSGNPGACIEWQRPSIGGTFDDPLKSGRQVRYVALNPCRAGLTDDPLRWTWSTHRDVVGAVADPWVVPDRLAAALRRPRKGFVLWLHRYVSSDPSVNVAGTRLPEPMRPAVIPSAPLTWVLAASAAATRGRPHDVRREGLTRRLFLHLARAHGWHETRLLASICGIRPRTVRWYLGMPVDPQTWRAAELCLGDERLRSSVGASLDRFLGELEQAAAEQPVERQASCRTPSPTRKLASGAWRSGSS